MWEGLLFRLSLLPRLPLRGLWYPPGQPALPSLLLHLRSPGQLPLFFGHVEEVCLVHSYVPAHSHPSFITPPPPLRPVSLAPLPSSGPPQPARRAQASLVLPCPSTR